MRKRTKKILRIWTFWISVLVWIFGSWIILTTQGYEFLRIMLGDSNIITLNSQLFGWIILILSNLYIIWRFVVHKKFPPY